jgi:hypothetical protein
MTEGYLGGENPSPRCQFVGAGDGHIDALRIEDEPTAIEYEAIETRLRHGRWTHDPAREEVPLLSLNYACVPGMEVRLPVSEANRRLFDDVMQSGLRHIAVCIDRPESDKRFSNVGTALVVKHCDFGITTEDDTQYPVAQCSVVGRVRIRKVYDARGNESAHRRAEVEPYDDVGTALGTSDLELRAKAALQRVVALQEKDDQLGLPEEVVTESTFSEDGLWKFVQVWQDVEILKVFAKHEQLQEGLRPRILEYMRKNQSNVELTLDDGSLTLSTNLEALPSDLRQECRMHENFSRQDGVPAEVFNLIDAILQSRSHAERLQIFIDAFEEEEKKLAVRAALSNLFS